jgi:hypothetical protein
MTTSVTTNDTGIPLGYPPADWKQDHLGMYGGDQIWRHLFPLLINPRDQQPLLTATDFAAFREHIGGLMSIISGAIFRADDSGPATLESTLKIVDNERARTSPAFAKYLDTLAKAKSGIDDAAASLSSAFALVENGLEDLADDLIDEAKDAAEEATDAAGR